MIDAVIVKGLAAGKRLVVPGFGAFIRKDEENRVVFVEFLKKDDGTLTGLLCEEFGVNPAQANDAINDYVVTLKNRVAETGSYVIEKLGLIVRDNNGNYDLLYDPSTTNAASPASQRPMFHPVVGRQVTSVAAATQAAVNSPTSGHQRAQVAPNIPPEVQPETISVDKTPQSTPQDMSRPFSGIPGNQKPVASPKATPNEIKKPSAAPVQNITNAPPRPAVQGQGYATPASGATGSNAPSQRSPSESVQQTAAPRPAVRPAVPSGRPGQRSSAGNNVPGAKQPGNVARQHTSKPKKKKRTDLIMIIAIIAALVAIGSMVYGILVNSDPIIKMQPTAPTEQVEYVPTESDQVIETEAGENR